MKRDNLTLLSPMNSKSIVDQIIERLTGTIMRGELKPGQKIPTEAELSESMHVARNSVREAIKALVSMGVLVIRRSEGTFVADGFSDKMLDPMVYGLVLEGGSTPAVVELRRIVEVGVLQLAVEKASDDDIRMLTQAFDSFARIVRENPNDSQMLLNADMAFHQRIQRIVANPMVERIQQVIERVSSPTRVRATEQFMRSGEIEHMIELHHQLLMVIRDRDSASVGRVMDDHFGYWKSELT